jgi:hypothetical protein
LFTAKLHPFETRILDTVGAALGGELKGLYSSQLTCINKVQRLLNWNEIEFYCMHFFKVRWPEPVLFPNRGEFVLGTGVLEADACKAAISVCAVAGRVFSIESRSALKEFRARQNVHFTLISVAA